MNFGLAESSVRQRKLSQTEKDTTSRDALLIRMNPTLKKRIFELAEEKGISANALILTILNDWLDRYGTPRFQHFNVYQDHITIYDNNIGGLVDVYKRGKKVNFRKDFDIYFGGVHAVAGEPLKKGFSGAADPRRDGVERGF